MRFSYASFHPKKKHSGSSLWFWEGELCIRDNLVTAPAPCIYHMLSPYIYHHHQHQVITYLVQLLPGLSSTLSLHDLHHLSAPSTGFMDFCFNSCRNVILIIVPFYIVYLFIEKFTYIMAKLYSSLTLASPTSSAS